MCYICGIIGLPKAVAPVKCDPTSSEVGRKSSDFCGKENNAGKKS